MTNQLRDGMRDAAKGALHKPPSLTNGSDHRDGAGQIHPRGFECAKIAAIGPKDRIVVATENGVLVAHKDPAQEAKKIVR